MDLFLFALLAMWLAVSMVKNFSSFLTGSTTRACQSSESSASPLTYRTL